MMLGIAWRGTRGPSKICCLVGPLIGFRLGPQVEMCTQPNSAKVNQIESRSLQRTTTC